MFDQGASRDPSSAVPLPPRDLYYYRRHQAGWDGTYPWSVSAIYSLQQRVNRTLLVSAVEYVLATYESLTLTMREVDGRACYVIGQEVEPSQIVDAHDLTSLSAAEQSARLSEIAYQTQFGHNVKTGPLLRLSLAEVGRGATQQRLIVSANHTVCDQVSFGIVVRALQSALSELIEGRVPSLTPERSTYLDSIRAKHLYAQSDGFKQDAERWREFPWHLRTEIPVDKPYSSREYPFLDQSDTGRVESLTFSAVNAHRRALNVSMASLLLGAAMLALRDAFAIEALDCLFFHNGRTPAAQFGLSLWDAVGDFSTIPRLLIEYARPGSTPSENVLAIDRQLSSVPHSGFVTRWLPLEFQFGAPVAFNYRGTYRSTTDTEALMTRSSERVPEAVDPAHHGWALLVLNTEFFDGVPKIDVQYSSMAHNQETARLLITLYARHLETLCAELPV